MRTWIVHEVSKQLTTTISTVGMPCGLPKPRMRWITFRFPRPCVLAHTHLHISGVPLYLLVLFASFCWMVFSHLILSFVDLLGKKMCKQSVHILRTKFYANTPYMLNNLSPWWSSFLSPQKITWQTPVKWLTSPHFLKWILFGGFLKWGIPKSPWELETKMVWVDDLGGFPILGNLQKHTLW